MNAHEWALHYVPDRYDSRQSLISVVDSSEASRSHPQGLLVLARVNVGAFAPHVDHALEIGATMAAAPALRSALIAMLNRYGDKSPGTTCDASRAAQNALAMINAAQINARDAEEVTP